MDRRTLLALLLTAIVIVGTPMVFPSTRQQPAFVDTVGGLLPDTVGTTPAAPAAPVVSIVRPITPPVAPSGAAALPETTLVRTERANFHLVSPGGTPARVTLPHYRSLRPGAQKDTPVELLEAGDRLFRLRLVSDRDTIAIDTLSFRSAAQSTEGSTVVQSLTSTSVTPRITLTYRFAADSFITHVDGAIAAPAGSAERAWKLLVSLPTRIRTEEANMVEDTRLLALGYKGTRNEVKSVSFDDLDTVTTRVDTGTIHWVTERNKYFLVAIAPAGADSVFESLLMRGGPRPGGEATSAHATAVLPVKAGRFSLRLYAGPQAWQHMKAALPDLENVNPYGGWLHGLVQPFATIVMRMLLWMRATFAVEYGWVLVIFGVMVRLALWPLNQNAMRSSMKLQRIQPQLAELQKKYKNEPEKQREAMMKLYQEHNMSPFTPVLGCLPMLLPMPILFALYFVFQNTIELRGVSFMWLPDLSLKDPLYITPLFMGLSMFLLSWIGMRGVPPSPQGKMMAYVMPVMFTALFWNFASGLNLYYAVQNVAALPQQWLLARERTSAKTTDAPKTDTVARKPDTGPVRQPGKGQLASGKGTRRDKGKGKGVG